MVRHLLGVSRPWTRRVRVGGDADRASGAPRGRHAGPGAQLPEPTTKCRPVSSTRCSSARRPQHLLAERCSKRRRSVPNRPRSPSYLADKCGWNDGFERAVYQGQRPVGDLEELSKLVDSNTTQPELRARRWHAGAEGCAAGEDPQPRPREAEDRHAWVEHHAWKVERHRPLGRSTDLADPQVAAHAAQQIRIDGRYSGGAGVNRSIMERTAARAACIRSGPMPVVTS